ncbi:MAG TPA: histidine kinase [Chitinophagales bacterium]|nr:histidine kinase [Chitinophagales bacterium]
MNNTENYSNEIAALHTRAESLMATEKAKASVAAQQAFELTQQTDDTALHAKSLLLLVRANEQFGDYNKEGLAYLDMLIEYTGTHNLVRQQIAAYNLKITHSLSSNMAEAERYCNLCRGALAAYPYENDDIQIEQLTFNYNYIQFCFRSQKNIEESLQVAYNSLEQAQQLKSYNLQCLFLQSIAMINSQMGNHQQTINYMEELISLAIENNDHANIIGAGGYVAYVYYTVQNIPKAEEKFEQAEHYAGIAKNIHALINVTLRKIRMYLEIGDLEKAAKSIHGIENDIAASASVRSANVFKFLKADYHARCKEALPALQLLEALSADELYMSDKNESMHTYQKMHELYSSIGQFEKAYYTLNKFYAIRADMTNEERVKKLTELQTQYDTERKETQLKQLQIDNLNSELRLLKSQMNPHFLFNAISSVNNLLQAGQSDEAQKSLQQLAVLTRSTLEQSRGEETLLEDEIAYLQSYLHLEKQVLGHHFEYNITVADTIDAEFEKIPSMIVQPLVENALKHGLRTKQGDKQVSIAFNLDDTGDNTVLTVTITDNGIGRAAASELNKHRKKHQSFATQAIAQRVKLINSTAGYEKIQIKINDLYTGNAPAGTQAVLTVTR